MCVVMYHTIPARSLRERARRAKLDIAAAVYNRYPAIVIYYFITITQSVGVRCPIFNFHVEKVS
jgi:hypothetical protein